MTLDQGGAPLCTRISVKDFFAPPLPTKRIVEFDDTPHALTQHRSNQNVGIEHEGFAWHANYFEFRLFSRLAR